MVMQNSGSFYGDREISWVTQEQPPYGAISGGLSGQLTVHGTAAKIADRMRSGGLVDGPNGDREATPLLGHVASNEPLPPAPSSETDILLGAIATAIRALPGHGAAVVKGKSVRVITPSGEIYNVTIK